MKTKQYTKAGLEALLQKARGINLELDKKYKLFNSLKDVMEETAARFASLGEDAKADVRECSEWATRCAGHATGAAEANNDACLWSESAHKAARFSLLCACVALLEFLGMVLIVIFFV